jgi:hypothetical protein
LNDPLSICGRNADFLKLVCKHRISLRSIEKELLRSLRPRQLSSAIQRQPKPGQLSHVPSEADCELLWLLEKLNTSEDPHHILAPVSEFLSVLSLETSRLDFIVPALISGFENPACFDLDETAKSPLAFL